MQYSKKFLAFVLTLAIITLLAACQPTPERSAVVPKGDDSKMDEVLNQPPPSSAREEIEKITAPSRWEKTVEAAKNMKINYNAEVRLPELEEYPIREMKPARFSQEMVDKFADYFTKGKKLFAWATEATKEDLEKELVEYMRGAEVDGEIIPPDPDDPKIEELKEQIRNAPSAGERIPAATELQQTENGGSELNLIVEWSENEDAMFTVENFGTDSYNSSFVFQRGGNLFDEYEAAMNNEKLKDSGISEEDAIAAANQTLADLQIDGMELSSVTRSEMQKMGSFAGMHSAYESSGYLMMYMRSSDGMSVIDTTNGGVYDVADRSTAEYLPAYSAPWYIEIIMVYVDENGVGRFSWTGYEEVGEKLVENAQLLSFEEMMERADKQLFYQNGGAAAYADQVDINVSRIELGWTLINQKNQPGKGLLVPAWHLFYDKEMKSQGAEEVYVEEGFLILNAIDGSVVDPLPA